MMSVELMQPGGCRRRKGASEPKNSPTSVPTSNAMFPVLDGLVGQARSTNMMAMAADRILMYELNCPAFSSMHKPMNTASKARLRCHSSDPREIGTDSANGRHDEIAASRQNSTQRLPVMQQHQAQSRNENPAS